MVLLYTGQSLEDLDPEMLALVNKHIHSLESVIIACNEYPHHRDVISCVHEWDYVAQDLENHKSIFTPVRCLPNDVLLYIFQMSFDVVSLNMQTSPWIFSYICHHWRALSCSTGSLWTDIFLESMCSSYPGKHCLCQSFCPCQEVYHFASPLRPSILLQLMPFASHYSQEMTEMLFWKTSLSIHTDGFI